MKKIMITTIVCLAAIAWLGQNSQAQTTAPGPDKKPVYVWGKYDPKLLLPLAVGNSWTYRWKCQAIKDDREIESKQPLYYGLMWYEFDKNRVLATCFHYSARAHEETYEIYRQDNENFFFKVTAAPPVRKDMIRDGRYEFCKEQCWNWWDKSSEPKGSVGLVECLKRDWSGHYEELCKDARTPKNEWDLPLDIRHELRVEFENKQWGRAWVEIQDIGSPVSLQYKPADNKKPVVVPAGTFDNCIETVEKFKKKEKDGQLVVWQTHMFWSPGIGKIYEFQQNEDNSIAYELELIRYKVKPATKP